MGDPWSDVSNRIAPAIRGAVSPRTSPFIISVVLTMSVAVAGCAPAVAWLPIDVTGPPVQTVPGGDPARGRMAIARYGCGACHAIPGVPGAHGGVGPPLDGVARRAVLGGHAVNSPENMVRWIEDPPSIAAGTDMPRLGVTDQDARDIAAYLFTLQ